VTNPFAKYVQSLHSLFNEEFMEAYNNLSQRIRRRVLPYLQSIHRRWYYSTLIDNIHFSPANIVDTIAYHCGEPQGTHITAAVLSPVSKMTGIDMKILSYSMDSHPVVADLRQLIKTCTPHVDLCEEWCFTDAQATKIAKKLTLFDPYYASFLLEVACKLELLARMPSLYVQRMQVTEKASSVLEQPDKELFRQITDIVIEMTAIGLQNTLPAPTPIFTKENLRNLLANPLTTDEIFEQAFGGLGFDLRELTLTDVVADTGDFTEESESMAEIMSGIFVLGVMLDRLFFTPFGHFLRIIRPIYSIPFEIDADISQYAYGFGDTEDDFAAFFAPCSSYTLTDIGLELFGIEPTEHNYLDSRTLLPPEVIEPGFSSAKELKSFVQAAQASIPISELPNAIYTFCITQKAQPSSWVHLQIPKSFTLHQLYEEIVEEFIADSGDYSFYHGKTENPFTEYVGVEFAGSVELKKLGSGKRSTKQVKNHTRIPLGALDFEHVKDLLLVVNTFEGKEAYALEWLNEFAPHPREHYPRTSEMSDDILGIYDELLNFGDFD